MERVALADLDSYGDHCASATVLTDALGADALALNHFELAPGETPSRGSHAHFDQEEVFYVLAGTVTFAVGDPRETTPADVAVRAGGAIRFAPGEYQRAWNRGDESARMLAMGAPQGSEDVDVVRDCPSCDTPTSQRFDRGDEVLRTVCVDCDTVTGRFT